MSRLLFSRDTQRSVSSSRFQASPGNEKKHRAGATWLLGSLCFLCVTAPLWFVWADESAVPTFTLQTASGATTTGPLQHLGENWSVRLTGAEPVDGGNLVALLQRGRSLPDYPADEQLLFFNGDRVPGHVLELAGERLFVRLPATLGAEKKVALPLSALSVLWLNAPNEADDPALLRRQLAFGQRPRDLVLLLNGDHLEGILSAMNEQNVEIDVDKQPVSVARAQVAAIALSTELANSLRLHGPYGRLVLADGARLSLASAACVDGVTLTGKTLFDAPVRIPVTQVVALYLFQGPAVYLSDLKPRRFEHTPYLDVTWPLVNDGSVAGRDLHVGGGVHDKGLGLHSACRVTYNLGGAYRRFEALVGLDNQTGRQGTVRIQVLVDGKPRDLGWDKELTAANGLVPLHVGVQGARELTLVVDFGAGGDVQDHVDWADARLIK